MTGPDLYKSWIDHLWNGPADKSRLIETAATIVTDDFVGHWPERDIHGPNELAELIYETKRSISGLTFNIEIKPFSGGGLVAGRWVGRGMTPDGAEMRFVGNDILSIRSDQFDEYWVASAQQ